MANVTKIKLPDNTEVNIRDSRVPSVSSTDNGKVLTVTSGAWAIGDIDSAPTTNSTNLVTSGGVYTALASKANASDIPDAVEANPTVPSGTTPTSMSTIKIGSSYYSFAAGVTSMTNNEIDTAVNTA